MSNNQNRKSGHQGGNQGQKAEDVSLQESKLAERQAAIDKLDFDPSEFERLRAENAQLKEDNAALQANTGDRQGGPALNPGTRVTIGNGYRFKVESLKEGTKLKPAEVCCCDESEAIRWYCCTTENPDRPGRQIKPDEERLKATCLDEKARMGRIIHDRHISMLKQKLNMGHSLTQDEMNELQAEEEKLVESA